MSTLYKSITKMDIHDTMYDIGRNLTHNKKDEIRIGENARVTQHDPEFENTHEGNDE